MPIVLWVLLAVVALYLIVRFFFTYKCSHCWNIFTQSDEIDSPEQGTIYINIYCPRCKKHTYRDWGYISMGYDID
ncbi:hypothetical protein C0580_02260 [Candidatus Parcubacteria bacterium]|nr:MAG: hypothetical protein C0580_02260 [Candidatus Parcubacteria bacterium]